MSLNLRARGVHDNVLVLFEALKPIQWNIVVKSTPTKIVDVRHA
jgi:hypothetical protein